MDRITSKQPVSRRVKKTPQEIVSEMEGNESQDKSKVSQYTRKLSDWRGYQDPNYLENQEFRIWSVFMSL